MHKAFVRFGLVHIAATNLCVWAYTSILETSEEVRLSSHNHDLEQLANGDVASLDNMTVAPPPLVSSGKPIQTCI